MIHRLNLLLLLLLFKAATAQQSFQKIYQPIDSKSMVITSDSGYFLVGSYGTFRDIVIIRTNSIGDTLWTRKFGESGTDVAEYVYSTNDGGFVVCGHTYSFGNNSEMLLMKLNSLGNIEWSKIYGGVGEEKALCMIQTVDGGYLLGGASSSSPSGSLDAALLRLDSVGTILWSKRFGSTTGLDQVDVIRQMPDGGFLIGGNSTVGNNWQLFLMRTDSFGDSLWTKTYASYSIGLSSLEFTNDGGYLIAGAIAGTFSAPSGILIKTDSLGNKLWSQYYGGVSAGFDGFHSVKHTFDGGFILTGVTNTWGFGGEDVLLVKTDSVGNVLWSKVYGDVDDERGLAIFQTSDGGFVIHGKRGTLNSSKIYLIKTDSLGNSNCFNAPVPVQSFYLFTTEVSPVWVYSSGWQESSQALLNYNSQLGVTSICIPVGVQADEENDIDLTVFPNPFSSETTLKISRTLVNASIFIINNIGQKTVWKTNISGNEVLIPRHNLPDGLYFMQLEESGQIIKSIKLMIVE